MQRMNEYNNFSKTSQQMNTISGNMGNNQWIIRIINFFSNKARGNIVKDKNRLLTDK